MVPVKSFSPGARRAAEWLGACLIVGFFVLRWWGRFYLTPDGGAYLTAAINLVRHRSMFLYINWPVRTLVPGIQYYADYPPGFPLYLSPFLLFVRDPLIAAGVAQSVALAAMFFSVYLVAIELGITVLFRLVLLFFLGMFAPHRDTLQSLLTEPLYLTLCFAILLCAIRIYRLGDSAACWATACLFLALAASVRWNGFACISFFLLPLWKDRRNFWRKGAALCFSGALPICLWFTRNFFVVGKASTFYGRPQLLWQNLPVPFLASVRWWGLGSAVLALAIFSAAFLPALSKRVRGNEDISAYWIVCTGALGQFLVIYGLSLVVLGMTPVDDRYLMPAYFLFSEALFYSLSLSLGRFRLLTRLGWAAVALVLVFGPTLHNPIWRRDYRYLGTWAVPAEARLWQQLRSRPYFAGVSHFYSNQNYLHQVFALMPQVVLWNERPTREQLKAWAEDPHSFFVIGEVYPSGGVSPLLGMFDGGLAAEIPGLRKEVIEGFTVYYHEPSVARVSETRAN